MIILNYLFCENSFSVSIVVSNVKLQQLGDTTFKLMN